MRMGHITIRTSHFIDEIRFYQEIAGLKIVRDLRDRGSNIVFLADREEQTRIEVIEEKGTDVSGNEHISIGFHTADAEALRKDLMAKGFDASPLTSPAPVIRFFFVKDPAGVMVQFLTETF